MSRFDTNSAKIPNYFGTPSGHSVGPPASCQSYAPNPKQTLHRAKAPFRLKDLSGPPPGKSYGDNGEIEMARDIVLFEGADTARLDGLMVSGSSPS